MSWNVVTDNADLFLSGIWTTLLIAISSWLLAVALGTAVALLRVTHQRPLRLVGACFVEFLRNVPPIVIIFFVFFALPSGGITLSAFASVVVGVGLYGAAVMAEIIRSGIFSIPRGQYESAISSGMSYLTAMRLVILPQALRIVIPPMGTETINVIKNTSLGAAVSAGEILGTANLVGSRTFAYVVVFLAAGGFYLALTWPIAAAFNALERALARR